MRGDVRKFLLSTLLAAVFLPAQPAITGADTHAFHHNVRADTLDSLWTRHVRPAFCYGDSGDLDTTSVANARALFANKLHIWINFPGHTYAHRSAIDFDNDYFEVQHEHQFLSFGAGPHGNGGMLTVRDTAKSYVDNLTWDGIFTMDTTHRYLGDSLGNPAHTAYLGYAYNDRGLFGTPFWGFIARHDSAQFCAGAETTGGRRSFAMCIGSTTGKRSDTTRMSSSGGFYTNKHYYKGNVSPDSELVTRQELSAKFGVTTGSVSNQIPCGDDKGRPQQPYSVPQTLTPGTHVNWDLSLGGAATLTMTGNETLISPTNLVNGSRYRLILTQDSTGGRLMSSWGAAYRFPGGVKPKLTAAGRAVDILEWVCDGTYLYCVNFVRDER